MTKEEIFLGLKDTLVSTFELEEEKVTMEANIVTDLDLDSIDIMDLIAELRRKVKCSFTADDYKQVRTVGDIVDVIYNKLQKTLK